jgi:hypothetical protein
MKFAPGDRVMLMGMNSFFFAYILSKFEDILLPGEIGVVMRSCECVSTMTQVVWDLGNQCVPTKWLKKIDDDGGGGPGSFLGTEYTPPKIEEPA